MSQAKKRSREEDTSTAPAKKQKLESTSTAPSKNFWLQIPQNVWNSFFEVLGFDAFLKYLTQLNKATRKAAYSSIHNLALTDESAYCNEASFLTTHISLMPNLSKLSLHGLDIIDDAALESIVNKAPHLTELQVSICPVHSPSIVSASLQSLKLSNCTDIHRLRIYSDSLTTFELYDCIFVRAPRLETPNLQTIKLSSCNELTDIQLAHMLSQFDANPMGQTLQDSQDTQSEPKVFKNKNLKTLWILDCASLNNALIKVDSLHELRIISCKALSKPFVRCINLHHLQMTWCESVENLNLGCDNLKKIDLTGTAVKHEKAEIRESIIRALQGHYEGISITY